MSEHDGTPGTCSSCGEPLVRADDGICRRCWERRWGFIVLLAVVGIAVGAAAFLFWGFLGLLVVGGLVGAGMLLAWWLAWKLLR